MYSLDDYHLAKAKPASMNHRWENYSGNNPNKFDAELGDARAELHRIEQHLKQAGLLPRTELESRDAHLDEAFPDAQSRQVVAWQGKRYMRRFSSVATSRSGKTVKAWHRYWQELPTEQEGQK